MKVGFEAVHGYAPGEVLKVREHYSYLRPVMDGLSPARRASILDNAPMEVRRLKDVSAAEIMSLVVANGILARAGLQAEDIDGLLVAQTGGKQFMPLIASYIHANLGLDREIPVRNIVDDDVSLVDAAKIAWSYVSSGQCGRVLIIVVAAQIGGQTSFGVDLTDPLAQMFGDGAAAAVVSSQNLLCEFLGYHSETYAVKPRPGGTLNGNIAPVRALANPQLASEAGIDDAYGAYLVLEDPLFDAVVGRQGFMADSLGRAAKKADIRLDRISTVIAPHIGALEDVWRKDLAEAGLHREVFRNSRQKYGDTAVADVLLSLADLSGAGQIDAGATIALWAACPGVQQATLMLRWL